MISYEVAMGMSLDPGAAAGRQRVASARSSRSSRHGLLERAARCPSRSSSSSSPGFAETNRLPFDLPEAESELVAGYHTEYSAMKFSMFFIAEYANMVTASRADGDAVLRRLGHPVHALGRTRAVAVLQDAGDRRRVLRPRSSFFLFVFMWVRWTLPRFRYDQLMALGWKVLLPLALAYIVVVAARDLLALDVRRASTTRPALRR